MPIGIFLYEIDDTFGPKIIAEYYLEKKLTPEALKTLGEKHSKALVDASFKKDDLKYYSSIINLESSEEKVYLGFILKEGEDLVSLKSLFENTEKVISNYFNKKDKKAMQELLKGTLDSILSLFDKLKEPKIIHDKINEKTKKLLDDGKLTEARALIDLGEKIPNQLSTEVKSAEQLFRQKLFKKAKKSYQKAADFARMIQEDEMVSFLLNKAEHVGKLPELLKERDAMHKEIIKIGSSLDANQLKIYPKLVSMVDKAINISNDFEDHEKVDTLTELKESAVEASKLAKDLFNLDKKINDLLNKI